MFAARQSFNLFQKRAFSASASQVHLFPLSLLNVNTNHIPQASKVAVLGAGGGIGQPLSLLLKLNPRVSDLALYDIRGGPGMLILLFGFNGCSSATLLFNC